MTATASRRAQLTARPAHGAAAMGRKPRLRAGRSRVTTTVDPERVAAAFANRRDAMRHDDAYIGARVDRFPEYLDRERRPR